MPMFNIDLNKVPANRAIAVTIFTFSAVIAPLWFIFQYNRALYDKTELINLLLISLSIGFPITVWNIILAAGRKRYGRVNRDDWFTWVAFGSFWAITVLYSPYIYNFLYFFKAVYSFSGGVKPAYKMVSSHQATGMAISFQILIMVAQSATDFLLTRKSKKTAKYTNNNSAIPIILNDVHLIEKDDPAI